MLKKKRQNSFTVNGKFTLVQPSRSYPEIGIDYVGLFKIKSQSKRGAKILKYYIITFVLIND